MKVNSFEEVIALIEQCIEQYNPESEYNSNNEFMTTSVNAASLVLNYSKFLFKKINKEFEITKATDALVLGTMVRAYKILDAITYFCCEHRADIASMLWRMLFESCVMVMHYTDIQPKNRKKYLIASYREVKGRYKDLLKKEEERGLNDIEKRMYNAIEESIKFDSLEVKDILVKKVKDVNVENMIKDYYSDEAYTHSYKSACSAVHGKWQDIRNQYLYLEDDRYLLKIGDLTPDPRYLMPHTIAYLNALLKFVRWLKIVDGKRNWEILQNLLNICVDIDTKHEAKYSDVYKAKYGEN